MQFKSGYKFAWYANETVMGVLERMVRDKFNVLLTQREQMGEAPELFLNGWPVLLSDKITSAETVVA
jgi:hypothetical protein